MSTVTIKDVAKHAGVAISTVSRVINGLNRVSDETRISVTRSIQELGYEPNITAKTLKAKKSQAIGLICEDITSPYIYDVLHGIEEYARKENYSVMVCNGDWKQENIIENLNILQNRSIDGIIYSTPLQIVEPLLGKLKELQKEIPFILISEDNFEDGFHRIELEIESGIVIMMNYLLGLGHKRISMIAGPENSGSNAIKIKTYTSIMETHGLSNYIQYKYSDLSMEQGERTADEFLDADPDRIPTVIVGAADLSAIGALRAVKKRGLRVPEDISLIGWGGIKYGMFTDPPISTMVVPRYELGEKAFGLLYQFIHDKGQTVNTDEITLPVELAIRESTGPVPRN